MPFNSEKVLAVPLTEFPERGIPRRAVADTGTRAKRDQPALYDFLQEAILDQPLPMRAAQVSRLEYRLQSNYAMQVQAYYAVLLQARLNS